MYKNDIERKENIISALYDVKDPEIPTLSVVDLGVVTDVLLDDENGIHIVMTPTFVGCPAIEVMKNDVQQKIMDLYPNARVEVEVNFDKPWDSNRITDKGKEILKAFGLAPPPSYKMELELDVLHQAKCPYCNGSNTIMQTPFGPTLCRSIHYCHDCMQAFEQFKPV